VLVKIVPIVVDEGCEVEVVVVVTDDGGRIVEVGHVKLYRHSSSFGAGAVEGGSRVGEIGRPLSPFARFTGGAGVASVNLNFLVISTSGDVGRLRPNTSSIEDD
jgi:hypothetical protein